MGPFVKWRIEMLARSLGNTFMEKNNRKSCFHAWLFNGSVMCKALWVMELNKFYQNSNSSSESVNNNWFQSFYYSIKCFQNKSFFFFLLLSIMFSLLKTHRNLGACLWRLRVDLKVIGRAWSFINSFIKLGLWNTTHFKITLIAKREPLSNFISYQRKTLIIKVN